MCVRVHVQLLCLSILVSIGNSPVLLKLYYALPLIYSLGYILTNACLTLKSTFFPPGFLPLLDRDSRRERQEIMNEMIKQVYSCVSGILR